MKRKLMIQSLSPLALLTIIKNFAFVIYDSEDQKLKVTDFITANLPLLIVISFCAIWLILAATFLISFNAFKYADRKSGFSISIIEHREEDSLNFFLTMILPLLIDDLNTWQGLILFFVIIALIWGLLSNTKLFYANPILALLGYRISEIAFIENEEKGEGTYIAISRGTLNDNHNIEYKDITKEVLFVKVMKK